MDPRSHIRTRLSFLGNFVFRTLRYLIFRARRVAPVQPCFSADKLNRPFYFGPRYILTAPRSRRSSPAFFPFPLPRPLHSRRDITAPYMSRVYPFPSFSHPLIAAEQIPRNQFSARLSLPIRYFITAGAECTAEVIRFSLHSSESSTNSYALRDNAIICMPSVGTMIIASISRRE